MAGEFDLDGVMARMSPQDRAKFQRDFSLFGVAIHHERPDGSCVRVHPKHWKRFNWKKS